ncbi:hypothetical protein SE17_21460 [Kouleothrix aurantiaca]|uniref:Uncharacterized protein n=1 Tax=Kouleothrix aurantiaca TaxID=186479 RepID=A0A0P9FEI0_9CHLR|nr:hypothetical protein SE17_21460 [Kouleothrix aurantiaca]
MPVNENRRLSPSEITSDRNAVSALNDLADYTSVNPNYSAEALATMEEELVASQQKERRAQTALDAARDEVTAKAWALRKAVQGAKAQVIAQYGPDSNAVAALGLKKKSEYRRPARRTDA